MSSDPHGYAQLGAWMLGIGIGGTAAFFLLAAAIRLGVLWALRAHSRELSEAQARWDAQVQQPPHPDDGAADT